MIILFIGLATSAVAADQGNWLGKEKGWLPPRVIYIADPTCRDYFNAFKEGGCEYQYFKYWAYGYISGLNDSLSNGGNVPGTWMPMSMIF